MDAAAGGEVSAAGGDACGVGGGGAAVGRCGVAAASQQEVRERVRFRRGQPQVRHAPRGARFVRRQQERRQRRVRVLGSERRQRRCSGQRQLAAVGAARRVASGAADRVEQHAALGDRGSVGGRRCGVAGGGCGAERLQVGGEVGGGLGAVARGEPVQQVGHRRARLDRVWRGQEGGEVGRAHAGRDAGEVRTARPWRGRRVRGIGVAGDAAEFVAQHEATDARRKFVPRQRGDDRRRRRRIGHCVAARRQRQRAGQREQRQAGVERRARGHGDDGCEATNAGAGRYEAVRVRGPRDAGQGPLVCSAPGAAIPHANDGYDAAQRSERPHDDGGSVARTARQTRGMFVPSPRWPCRARARRPATLVRFCATGADTVAASSPP